MPGGESLGARRRVRATLVLGAIGLLAVAGAAEPAAAKKKKKKSKPAVVTATASVPLAPGSQQTANANCIGKTHVTGGGWSVSAVYNPNGTTSLANDTGTRITHLQSAPTGTFGWAATAAAFTLPANAGTLTAVAQCENKAYSKVRTGVSGTSTIPIGQETTVDLNCQPGTHVVSGGFSFTPAGNLGAPGDRRPIVVESRRLDVTTWQIHIINPIGSPSAATLSSNVLCELNEKGVSITEATASAPIVNENRTTVTASCTGKTHTIGGGFLVQPYVGPAVGIDQMQPVGAKAWQVGLYEYPAFSLPPGSTVAAYSYCRKNALPNQSKKKSKKK